MRASSVTSPPFISAARLFRVNSFSLGFMSASWLSSSSHTSLCVSLSLDSTLSNSERPFFKSM